MAAADVLKLPAADVRKTWKLMFDWLVGQGLSAQDAEDVVQEVFIRILSDPERYLDKLTNLEEHKGWFLWLALHRYLMMLRAERRRRQRELAYCFVAADPDDEVLRRGPGAEIILVLAKQAKLTNRQRAYLRAVVVDHLTIADIAEVTATTPRAVRAVLQRAGQRLRQQLVADLVI